MKVDFGPESSDRNFGALQLKLGQRVNRIVFSESRVSAHHEMPLHRR